MVAGFAEVLMETASRQANSIAVFSRGFMATLQLVLTFLATKMQQALHLDISMNSTGKTFPISICLGLLEQWQSSLSCCCICGQFVLCVY